MTGPSTPTKFLDDFDPGFEIETASHLATTEEIISFATKYDPQPFHMNAEAAKHSLLGGLCASGWHTCSLSTRLVYDAFLKDCATQGFPEFAEVRWRRPLFVEETIFVKVRCTSVDPSEADTEDGWVSFAWETRNTKGDTIALFDCRVPMARAPEQEGV